MRNKPVRGRLEPVSDWTAPCGCTRLCAGPSCSLLAGSECWGRSPGFLLSTANKGNRFNWARVDMRDGRQLINEGKLQGYIPS